MGVGYGVRDLLQVVLDVLAVVVYQGGEVIQMGLGLWVQVLQWVKAKYVLIGFIGLVVGLGYAWWAARASGLVSTRTALRVEGAGKSGRLRPSPGVAPGGSSASEEEADVKEEVDATTSSNLRIIAADRSKLIALRVVFLRMLFWSGKCRAGQEHVRLLSRPSCVLMMRMAKQGSAWRRCRGVRDVSL